MKINKVKIAAIFVVVLTLVSTFGLVINSKAGDEELSYGYVGTSTTIQSKANFNDIKLGEAIGGDQWRADCLAMKGQFAGPVDKKSTQWWHARDLRIYVLGYVPRAFMTTTRLATTIWAYDGDTCKRGGGPGN